jgi:hypothetical protein
VRHSFTPIAEKYPKRDMGVQKHNKIFYKKVLLSFYQKNDKNPKPIFLDFLYHVLGRFSVRGVQKHHEINIQINKYGPGPFLAPDPPTRHWVTDLFLAGPLLPRLRTYARHKYYKTHRLTKNCFFFDTKLYDRRSGPR